MTEKQLYTKVKIITVTCVAFVVVLLVFILFQCVSLANLNSSKEKLESRLAEYNRQVQSLEDEIEYRNSRTYIEQYARENLGYCYSDEYKYKIEE